MKLLVKYGLERFQSVHHRRIRPAMDETCGRVPLSLAERSASFLVRTARQSVGPGAPLSPASFFEKEQAIDNATKVANFGTLYWAHLRLGRLNGPKLYCVRGGF